MGPNATRSSKPDCNRYVEAVVDLLVAAYPSDERRKTVDGGRYTNTRWNLITNAYSVIWLLVNDCGRIMDLTDIQIPRLNSHSIRHW